MYYVAFFKDYKKNKIVPKQWIKDIKLHKEKFINNSLNSSQTFICFYTNNAAAFDDDGVPIGNFVPNFNAPLRCNFQEGDLLNGLYRIQLKAYKGNKNEFSIKSD